MGYKEGQAVTLRRNLGKENNMSSSSYYYGGNKRVVPLGSKASVYEIISREKLIVRLQSGEYWYVHPDELKTGQDDAAKQKMISEKQDLVLSDLLAESVSDDYAGLGTKTQEKKFAPKFNAREEFAVWIREEFPELRKHANERSDYAALKNRKQEIISAAKQAYDHAFKTIGYSCITSGLQRRLEELSRDDFEKNLDDYVTRIEHIASNL